MTSYSNLFIHIYLAKIYLYNNVTNHLNCKWIKLLLAVKGLNALDMFCMPMHIYADYSIQVACTENIKCKQKGICNNSQVTHDTSVQQKRNPLVVSLVCILGLRHLGLSGISDSFLS